MRLDRTLLVVRLIAAVLSGVVAVSLAGCAGPPDETATPVASSQSAATFPATRCREGLGRLQDVEPRAGTGAGLVDGRRTPSGALTCRYGSVFDQGPGPRRTPTAQIRLGPAAAGRLARAASAVAVGAPRAPVAGCPNDAGLVIVIVIVYPVGPVAELWWNADGCRTVDDGRVRAEQIANDSFAAFQRVFEAATRRPARGSGRPR